MTRLMIPAEVRQEGGLGMWETEVPCNCGNPPEPHADIIKVFAYESGKILFVALEASGRFQVAPGINRIGYATAKLQMTPAQVKQLRDDLDEVLMALGGTGAPNDDIPPAFRSAE